MGQTLLSVLMALSNTDNPETRHAFARNMAISYCVKINKNSNLDCQVTQMVYSQIGNEYIDHATALVQCSKMNAAISMSFRYGSWYVDSFDMETLDAGY